MNNSLDYQTYYSVKHPGLWVLLTDEEEESINPINRFINECIQGNFNGKDVINRCYIHVIGINGAVHRIASGYLSDLENNPIEIIRPTRICLFEDGISQIQVNKPIWCKRCETRQEKKMLEALKSIVPFLREWMLGNPDSPVPIVWYVSSELIENFNYSSKIKKAINDIKAINCKDGNVLFCNVFSSTKNDVLLDERNPIVQFSSPIPHGRILDNFRYWADNYTDSFLGKIHPSFWGNSPRMSFNLSFFERLYLPIMGHVSEPSLERGLGLL